MPHELLDPPAVTLAAGCGQVATKSVAGHTRLVRLSSHAPLKLLVPRHSGPVVTVYGSTYGGGLLAGDLIDLCVEVGENTTLFLRSQSATKIYRSEDGRPSQQRLTAVVRSGATLVSIPDPVTCFAGARYEQKQSIELSNGASVLQLDWATSGRSARGETWAFDRYATCTNVRCEGKSVFVDASVMDSADLPVASHFRGGRFGCFATVILIGPAFASDALTLRDAIATMAVQRQADLIASSSPIASDGVLVRLAATTTQRASEWLMSNLQFLSRLTGSDPFGRKW